LALNKIEAIKSAKHPLDTLDDIYRYAKLGWEAIPEDDWDRMKWYGLFFRRATPGHFMMRLRIPNGILTTAQLRAIADIVCDYGRDQADLTTRENIQLRWVTIEHVPDIFARLHAVGLTSQQSGMDNMRNVVGCPIAGLDPAELLDASSLAQELQESFVGVRELSNLPRKFNVSITGCRQDCGHAQAHDLSFVPATFHPHPNPLPQGRGEGRDGEALTGFNVLVGGALGGKDPQLAVPLDAFVLPGEVAPLNRAVLEVFRDHGPREARNKARLKVLLTEWGIERFRAAVEERLGETLARAGQDETVAYGGDHIGIHEQRQPGRCYAGLLVPVGRVTGTQLRELARLGDVYGAGEVRPPLAPIQAGPAQGALTSARVLQIDAEAVQELDAGLGQRAGLAGEHHVPARLQRVGEPDAEPAGQVVVAGARGAQRLVDLRERARARRRARRHHHDAFEHASDQRARQPVVTVAALAHAFEQPGLGQLGEVAAGRLRRDAGGVGELLGGERAAVHQRAQDVGARRIADRRRNLGQVGSDRHAGDSSALGGAWHGSTLRPRP